MQGLEELIIDPNPWFCGGCRSLWHVLASNAPNVVTASECADQLGYRNRYQLIRWLGAHGYPPYVQLADWTRTLGWLLEYERSSTSLVRQAWSEGVDPSVCYRTVRRLSGTTWRHIRGEGKKVWVDRLGVRLHGFIACSNRQLNPRTAPLSVLAPTIGGARSAGVT